MSDTIPEMNKRITLKGFGAYHYKWGKLWAHAKNRTLSRLVADVFEARVEENHEKIERMIADEALQRGISTEELIAEILNSDDD